MGWRRAIRNLTVVSLAAVASGQVQPDAAGYFKRGLAALRSQNLSEAQSLIKAGLDLDPNSSAGYDLLGIASAELGNFSEAEKLFRRAISLNPRFVGAHNDLARFLYRRGMVDAAIQEFHAALQFDPRNFTAHFNLGLIYRERQRYPQAVEHLQIARELMPSDIATLLALTDAYFHTGEAQEGIALSRQLLSSHADDPQVNFSMGTLLLEQKEYAEAAACLERARVAEPQNFELLHDLGQAYTHLGKYAAAENAFLAALSLRENAVQTLYQLAIAYTEWGHADQAIQVLVRARGLAPARPDVLLLLGRVCIREGFIDDAIEVLQRCAALNPDKVDPHLLLGEAFTKRKDYDKALAEYEIMAKLDPRNPQSHVSLGRTYEYMRQYRQAEHALSKALAIDSKATQAAYYMGRIAADEDDYTAAKRWYTRVLAVDPKNLAALYDMAVALMHEGNNVLAREYLEKAISVEPAFSQLYYRLSVVERRLNRPEQAKEAFALFKKYEDLDRQRRDYHSFGVLDFVKETQGLPETERWLRYRDALLKTAETHPDDLNVLFMQAQVYFRLGDNAHALERLAQISSLQPDDAAARMRSASLLTSFNHFTEAVEQLRSALEKHPDAGDVRFALAALYYRMRRLSDAREVLSRASTGSARLTGFHNLLGRVLVEQHDVEQGLNQLQQAVSSEPNNENYVADLAIELAASGQTSRARALVERARTNDPTSVQLLLAEGVCFQLAGNHAAARTSFRKASELGLDSEVPYLAEGNLLRENRARGAAVEILDRAAGLFPDSPWPHWLKALTLEADAPAQAQSEFRTAVALAQAQPYIYPALLTKALGAGDCRAASEIWDRMKPLALSPELDPSHWCTGDDVSRAQPPVGGAPLPVYPEWRWIVELARR